MRTSDKLPDECREEIRAELREHELHLSDGAPYNKDWCEAFVEAFKWVLGDDGK